MSKKTLFCLACEMPKSLCNHKPGHYLEVNEGEFFALTGRKPKFSHLSSNNQNNLKELFAQFNK